MIISVIFIFCLNILIPLHEGLSYPLDDYQIYRLIRDTDYQSSTEDIIEENRSDPYGNDDIYQTKFGTINNEIQLLYHCIT